MKRVFVGWARSLILHKVLSFIYGMQIMDGTLITSEVVDELRRRKRRDIIIKLDFGKAYDKVDWGCILGVMRTMGFCEKNCNVDKGMFSFSSYIF